MKRLTAVLLGTVLATLAASGFAATLNFVPSLTYYAPTVCTPDKSICSWSGSGTIQVAGLVNPSYGNPYFIEIRRVEDDALIGWACGYPTHCSIINDGNWLTSWTLGAGEHHVYAELHLGDGPPLPIEQAGAFGQRNTSGTRIAVSQSVTIMNIGSTAPPSPPTPPTPPTPPPTTPPTTTPPTTTPPTPPSPPSSGTTSTAESAIPPSASIMDDHGDIWTVPAGGGVRRNGIEAGGFYASRLVWTYKPGRYYIGGDDGWRDAPVPRIEAQNKDNGSWSLWDGNWWRGVEH